MDDSVFVQQRARILHQFLLTKQNLRSEGIVFASDFIDFHWSVVVQNTVSWLVYTMFWKLLWKPAAHGSSSFKRAVIVKLENVFESDSHIF